MWGTMHILGREADIEESLLPILKTLVSVYANRLKGQDCREHFQSCVKKHPILPGRAFEWTVLRHNEVSQRIGKPTLTLEDAYDIWDPSNIRIGACSEYKNEKTASNQSAKSSVPSSSTSNLPTPNTSSTSAQAQVMSTIQSYNNWILQMGENVSMNPMSMANMFLPKR